VIFILSELEELSDPEIARMQRIPVGTVASRLRRARKEFQESVRRVLSKRQAVRRSP
jgi:RNA polymerase sigma-70 factor (ECF subfamily)